MDNFPSKKVYLLFYKVVSVILTLFIILAIYNFLMLMWINRQPYIDIFDFNVLHDANAKDYSSEDMIQILKFTATDFGKFIITVFVLNLIKYLWKIFPVPSRFIKLWDDSSDISHVLGRLICLHLRDYRTISNKDFDYINSYSKDQKLLFNKASKNPNYSEIFKKYDLNYLNDIQPLTQNNEKLSNNIDTPGVTEL